MLKNLSLLVLASTVASALTQPAPAQSVERLNLGLRGVYFVQNDGQWSDSTVIYGYRAHGLDVAFRESSLTMHIAQHAHDASRQNDQENPPLSRDPKGSAPEASDSPTNSQPLTLTVTFPGSNPVQPIATQPQTAKFNYFIGDDQSRWHSNVPSFAEIIYENLYDGIDLHVRGSDDGILKYEFHCAPSTNYSQIQIHYDGIDSLCLDNTTGNLQIQTALGTLADAAPKVWSMGVPPVESSRAPDPSSAHQKEVVPGHQSESARSMDHASSNTIPAQFELIDPQTCRITLDADVDASHPLVIDPQVEWMYFYGGSAGDYIADLVVDATSDVFLTGPTASIDFEGHTNEPFGGTDAFAVRVESNGLLVWMTYLGGTTGGGHGDSGSGVAVDDDGNVFVVGTTDSADFVGHLNSLHGIEDDAFAARLNIDGQIQWMTYLGGESPDSAADVGIDSDGNVFLTGTTQSSVFEGQNNNHHGGLVGEDVFVVKLDQVGTTQWMTFLGGSWENEEDYYGDDIGRSIAVSPTGDSFVTGDTSSNNFAGQNNETHGEVDAFLAAVSSSGVQDWMYYLGGNSDDMGRGVARESTGDLLITGSTASLDFEGRLNSYHGGVTSDGDCFVMRLSPTGMCRWMRYFGGANDDWGTAICSNEFGDVFVTGTTKSSQFEGRKNNPYRGNDAFALKTDPSGILQWMTYVGGTLYEAGQGIAVSDAAEILVAGDTSSPDFEGHGNSIHGRFDAFLTKLLDSDPVLSVLATCPSGGPIRVSWSHASVGGQIALLYSQSTGSFSIPSNHPCAGAILGLGTNQLRVAFQGSAGVKGSRTLNATAPPSACGSYLQLIDLTTCNTSNVARIE